MIRIPSRIVAPDRLAFSLVEVVLGVGIVGFVAVAILGLAAVASNSTREADLNSRTAFVMQHVMADLQSRRFDFSDLTAKPIAVQYGGPTWFDAAGSPLPNANGKFFTCDVTDVTPTVATPGAPLANSINFRLLRLQITTPVSQNATVISVSNSQKIQLTPTPTP